MIDDPDSSMKFCKFAASSCPSSGGWTRYKNWSTTTSGTGINTSTYWVFNFGINSPCVKVTVNYDHYYGHMAAGLGHVWSDTLIESCPFWYEMSDGMKYGTLTINILESGYY